MTKPVTGQDIGQAQAATRAVLDRLLADTDTDFVEWVVINLLGGNQSRLDRADLVARAVDGLKVVPGRVATAIDALADRGLCTDADGVLALTPDGEARYRRVRAGIGQITERLYGGIPAEDLHTAQRVLATVTERANTELAG
jgi:DNA-binding MarR family transcriptional regulator